MPTGIYDRTKSKPNAGLFKKGEHRSPNTEIKQGQNLSPNTEFKLGIGYTSKRNFYSDEEWLLKQSESHKGQHSSPNTEFQQGEHKSPDTEFKAGDAPYISLGGSRPEFSGENHPNWKGGITKELPLLRNKGKYHKWRREVFLQDNYICHLCGTNEDLEAHHIKSFSQYPELRYEVSNGIVLCQSCHKTLSDT